MPKLKIENINYIVTGRKEKIINLDVFSETDGRTNNMSFFTDTDTVSNSDIFPNVSMHIGVAKENGISATNANVNSHGFVFLDSDGKVARALFDAKDVAMRSKVAQRLEDKSMSEYGGEDFTNAYLPHLKKNPLGFAQLENFSYGMTDSIVVAPVIKMTSLSEKLMSNALSDDSGSGKVYSSKPIWNSYLNPYDRYGSQSFDPGILQNLLPIYTYTPLENLSTVVYEMLSTEYDDPSISAKAMEIASSYDSFRDFVCENGKLTSMISVLFKPVYNFQNIDHNYILEVPIDVYQVKDNDYANGSVYADMIMGKNVYNDLYDMDISSLGTFSRVREYTNIHQTGGRLFTNYFDDVLATDGSVNDFNNTYNDKTENIDLQQSSHPSNQTRDYMKVECIDAINRFVALTNHKANLFSVKVYGLNSVLSSNDMLLKDASVANNIRKNIQNSINRIVTNFVPAHTQYFGTSFEGDFSKDFNSTEKC